MSWPDALLARLVGIGAAIAALVLVVSVIVERPLPAVSFLLLPGIPLLAIGQIRVAGLHVRQRPITGSWLQRSTEQQRIKSEERTELIERLPPQTQRAIRIANIVGIIAFATSFIFLLAGDPTQGQGGCPYGLDNHGDITCISQFYYDAIGAALNRLVASTFLLFLSNQYLFFAREAVRDRLRERAP